MVGLISNNSSPVGLPSVLIKIKNAKNYTFKPESGILPSTTGGQSQQQAVTLPVQGQQDHGLMCQQWKMGECRNNSCSFRHYYLESDRPQSPNSEQKEEKYQVPMRMSSPLVERVDIIEERHQRCEVDIETGQEEHFFEITKKKCVDLTGSSMEVRLGSTTSTTMTENQKKNYKNSENESKEYDDEYQEDTSDEEGAGNNTSANDHSNEIDDDEVENEKEKDDDKTKKEKNKEYSDYDEDDIGDDGSEDEADKNSENE